MSTDLSITVTAAVPNALPFALRSSKSISTVSQISLSMTYNNNNNNNHHH